MKGTFLQDKSEALRQVCRILHYKYHVNVYSVARAMGLDPRYYAAFVEGRRSKLFRKNLTLIENYIFDLYESILTEELELNNIHIPLEEEYEKVQTKN